MENKYRIEGSVMVIEIKSPTFGHLETTIDADKLDYMLNNVLRVWVQRAPKTFYAICKTVDGRIIPLHRALKGEPKGKVVDHKDRNGLNNVDSNLRVCTHSENSTNKVVQSNNNTSGVRGVRYDPASTGKPWRGEVRQRTGGKNIYHLNSRFSTKEEAEQAVIETRKKVFPFDATIQ